MPNQIIARRYTAEKAGVFFTLGMDSEVALQDDGGSPALLLVGGGPANAADYPMPRQMLPRRAKCVNPAGNVRYIPLLTPTAPLATPGAQIELEDSDGVATTYDCKKVLGEEYRERNKVSTS